MRYEHLIVETIDGNIGVIRLNRPAVLNALSHALQTELDAALAAFDNDPDIRCIILSGTGEKAFSAGGDIHEMAALDPAILEEQNRARGDAGWLRATLRKPTIGALNGLAYGGGAVLAASLDIRIGCERTRFRFLAASYGRINSTWCLPAVVGLAQAKELLYTARVVDADDALRIGLLNKLVPSDGLMDAAVEMARQIAANTPEMVQGIKHLLDDGIGRSWREMYDAEHDLLTTTHRPSPVREGFKEFLNRKGDRASREQSV
ncbi:MAG: enoyl-CoA hydratase/isomerase family protein [Chloroflexi bacterium]|nr:enoyl-CoA hydratase/isomerase family protein [Chloroflexota bacterium]